MALHKIKRQEGSLRKLKALLDNENLEVQGVNYDNRLMSKNYLCRSDIKVHDIDIKEGKLEITVLTRVDATGIIDLENILDELVHHKIGDIPGYVPYDDNDPENTGILVPEPVSVTHSLYGFDLYLIIEGARLSYKEFTIAGKKFTLFSIYHDVGDVYSQEVHLLFGEAGKLSFLSNFYDSNLSVRDSRMIIDLIVENNMTGRAITGVRQSTANSSTGIFPDSSLVTTFLTRAYDYVFNTETSYIRIPQNNLKEYKMTCTPSDTKSGAYEVALTSSKDTVQIFFE